MPTSTPDAATSHPGAADRAGVRRAAVGNGPGGGPPLDLGRLRDQVRQGRIGTVLLALPDLYGTLRGRVLDAGFFLDQAERGLDAIAYLLATDLAMRPVPDLALTGWADGFPDVRLVPDLATLRPAGWQPGSAVVLADMAAHDGAAVQVAPRQVLRRQLARLAEHGLTASLGVESECAAYSVGYEQARADGYRGLEPLAGHDTAFALTHEQPRLDAFLRELAEVLAASALPLEALKIDGAHGQIETTFRHAEPLAAADHHVLYKAAAKALGARAGIAVTFMAKPFTEADGASCHLHLSLADRSGQALFELEHGGPGKLGGQAIAGCLAALGDFAPFYAPAVNSYKRFRPYSWAPGQLDFGIDNRTCALRLTGRGPDSRVECRLPGADANPYLAAAALIAAILHGIENGRSLETAPVVGNAYQYAADNPQSANPLPANLAEAARRFRGSAAARAAFGDEVVDHYAQVAVHEAQQHDLNVTDLERAYGFTRA
ncbi:MAG TPA: glutamine synthetase family protein [Actinocrinis sp.]|nr:glutamine synthetase family protein [Actinocrinis sp.]